MYRKKFELKELGFTLVELLGVIAVLGIIALIMIRPINRYIINSKQNLYENQLTMIELAARNWGTDHLLLLPTNEGDSVFLSLCQLQSGGYFDERLKNVITEKSFYADTAVSITKREGKYIYQVEESTGSSYVCPDLVPTLVINGDATQYVELGSAYVPAQYRAYSVAGENITNKVSFWIKKDGEVVEKINPYLLGTYTITYSIEDDGVLATLDRTVIVRDTTPPVITLNGSTKNQSTSIDAAPTYYAPLAEVTDNSLYINTPYHVTCGGDSVVTENGGACIGISSVNPKIDGDYEVKYVAVDEFGNETTLIYTVTVKPDVINPELVITGNNKWILVGTDFNVFTNGLYTVTDVGAGVEKVEAVINEESITNTKDLPVGLYTITFTAYDYAKNSSSADCNIEIGEASYTIVFHENRATTGTTNIVTQTNTDVTMPADPFAAKFGFTFKEWNTKANGTGTSYAAGSVVRNLTTIPDATVNLYAIWERPDTLYVFNGGTPAGMSFSAAAGGATATVGSTLYLKSAWYKFPSITSSVIDVTGYSKFHIYVSSASAPWKGGSGTQARSNAGATFAGKTIFFLEKTSTSGEKVVDISDITSGTFVLSASCNGDADGWTNAQSSTVTVTKIWLTK